MENHDGLRAPSGALGRILTDPLGAGELLGIATDSGELSWTLLRHDGSTQRLGTSDEILDQIDELEARNVALEARRDEMVSHYPELKARR
jgi:hypothetical protein